MRMKKFAAVLAVAAVFVSNAMCVSAAVPEGAFDAAYYADSYADLRAVFGGDGEKLYAHFLQNGIAEGRVCSPDFDVRAYRANYPDLEAAFGDNWDAYFWHYLNYGKNEGRIATGSGENGAGGKNETGANAGNTGANTDTNADIQFMYDMAKQAFDTMNGYRISAGVPALAWSDTLYEAAKIRAKELSVIYNPTHDRPDGSSCFTVLGQLGIGYRAAAENIAAGYTSGDSVALAWYNSEGHRRNMLNGNLGQSAVACYYEPNGYGGYVYYWAHEFTD